MYFLVNVGCALCVMMVDFHLCFQFQQLKMALEDEFHDDVVIVSMFCPALICECRFYCVLH